MKKIFYYFFFVMVLLAKQVNADHIFGYEMTLVSLGNDLYKIRLITYGDLAGITGTNAYQLNLYRNADNAPAPIASIIANRISSAIISNVSNDCPPFTSVFSSIRKNVYESLSTNLSTFNAVDGYYAVADVCCRQYGIVNLVNLANEGILITMDFPRLDSNSNTRNNKSPQFLNNPSASLRVGKRYELDWSATDLDNDSLVYKLVKPRGGARTLKPFVNLQYAAGFKLDSNIADGNPDFSVNQLTGLITYKPRKLGAYAVALKVEEWKRATGSGPAVKIGEITREILIEVNLNPEVAPVITSNLGQKSTIIDSVYFDSESSIIFTAQDANMDSLFMVILPDTNAVENIFNANTFAARWGGNDTSLLTGQQATNLVIRGQGQVTGKFRWKTKCSAARTKPYTFKVLVRDNTCLDPLYDTTEVFIYVLKTPNTAPFFISPDTVKSQTIKKYYINAGDDFELAGDSVIKAVDLDSSANTVMIYLQPFESNGSINQEVIFALFPSYFESTAIFKWRSGCKSGRAEPYKFTLLAVDNDCLKPDSVSFELHIYVAEQISATPISGLSVISDTSLVYSYTTTYRDGVDYFWYGEGATILSGQGTDSVTVKWRQQHFNQLVCLFSSSQTDCVDSTIFNISLATGLSDGKNASLKIFPNPINDFIQIQGLDKNVQTIIQVYDIRGQVLMRETLVDNGLIDVSHLAKGLYIVNIAGVVHRLIKL